MTTNTPVAKARPSGGAAAVASAVSQTCAPARDNRSTSPGIDASVSRKHQVHAGKGDTRLERRLGSCAIDQERHARGARRSHVLCIRRQCE